MDHKSVQERVGMDVKGAGTHRDGTEIPSPCRPLAGTTRLKKSFMHMQSLASVSLTVINLL